MLQVTDLSKFFAGHDGQNVNAVQDVDFAVPEGKLFTLLGPSGCGKTTTLRCIAGLEHPRRGQIRIGDQVVFDQQKRIQTPAHERPIAMVFQSYAIWPHMTVFANVAFPLQVARPRLSKAAIEERVMAALERVQMSDYAGRDATRLSGGQQQRLALARAMVRQPKLLLLDEPLSNLDAKLREHMRFELKRLQRDLGVTTLYVTHDQTEALAVSHQIAVMRNGRIEQIGTPREIYERPATQFVAAFIGSTNFLDGAVTTAASPLGETVVQTEIGALHCATSALPLAAGKVLVYVRPEHVQVTDRPSDAGQNAFRGRLRTWAYLGDCIDLQIAVGEQEVRARCHPDLTLTRDSDVWIYLPPARCVVLTPDAAKTGLAVPPVQRPRENTREELSWATNE